MPAIASIFKSHLNPLKNSAFTWAELKHAVEYPTMFHKELSDELDEDGELISNKGFSSCIAAHDCDRKTNEAITEHNSMSYLRVDSDDNAYTIETIKDALISLGINTFVAHSSWSNKIDYHKLKVLIPLSTPLCLDEWRNIQERLTESLGCDECMNKPAQISYLPATYPDHEYQYTVIENGQHDFNLLPQLRPKPVIQKRTPQKHEGDSMIAEFNSRWDWDFELQANGYKKKGKKWLSPSATSKLAGGSVWTTDDGKQLFSTFHTSDPINALGAVDGFAFAALKAGMSDAELCLQLANGELKDWNKQKQKEFVEGKEQKPVLNDADFAKFADIFAKKQEVKTNPFFGNVTAPTDGCYEMPKDEPTAVQKVLKTVQFAPKDHQPEKSNYGTPDHIFPTPVDESINLYAAHGLVGECIDYINSVGRKPRRTLAVSTALSVLGLIGGLTHEDAEYGATPNLFCFNIAGSGSGKEAVLQAANDIISESGIKNSMFGKIKSEQEIYRNLINSQAAYYNIDEIGEVLGKITASTETYMTGIIGTLMSLYSKANGKINLGGDELTDIKERTSKRVAMLTKRIDDNEDKAGTAQEEIDKLTQFMENLNHGVLINPFLSISGCTTPELFSKIATKQNVLSGFIGRSLMFREDNDVPRSNYGFKPGNKFPLNLSHELKKVFNIGNQKTITVGRTQNYGDKVKVTTSPDALKWLNALQYNIETQAIEHSETDGLHPIINRQFELILKVSLVLAMGDGKVRTLEHVKWAQYLVSRDVETKIDMVKGNDEDLSTNKADELMERVIKTLEKQGRMTQGRMVNRITALDDQTCTKILKVLYASKMIKVIEPKAKGGKNKYELV